MKGLYNRTVGWRRMLWWIDDGKAYLRKKDKQERRQEFIHDHGLNGESKIILRNGLPEHFLLRSSDAFQKMLNQKITTRIV